MLSAPTTDDSGCSGLSVKTDLTSVWALRYVLVRGSRRIIDAGGRLPAIADGAGLGPPHSVVVVAGADENVGDFVANRLLNRVSIRIVGDVPGEREYLLAESGLAETGNRPVKPSEPPALCVMLRGEFLQESSGQFRCVFTIHSCFL